MPSAKNVRARATSSAFSMFAISAIVVPSSVVAGSRFTSSSRASNERLRSWILP